MPLFKPREEAAITFQRILDVIRTVEIHADATDFSRLLYLIDDAIIDEVPIGADPEGQFTENNAQRAFLLACREYVTTQRDMTIRSQGRL